MTSPDQDKVVSIWDSPVLRDGEIDESLLAGRINVDQFMSKVDQALGDVSLSELTGVRVTDVDALTGGTLAFINAASEEVRKKRGEGSDA